MLENQLGEQKNLNKEKKKKLEEINMNIDKIKKKQEMIPLI